MAVCVLQMNREERYAEFIAFHSRERKETEDKLEAKRKEEAEAERRLNESMLPGFVVIWFLLLCFFGFFESISGPNGGDPLAWGSFTSKVFLGGIVGLILIVVAESRLH